MFSWGDAAFVSPRVKQHFCGVCIPYLHPLSGSVSRLLKARLYFGGFGSSNFSHTAFQTDLLTSTHFIFFFPPPTTSVVALCL